MPDSDLNKNLGTRGNREADFYNKTMLYNPGRTNLNKSQKIAVIVLAFFAFLVIIMWIIQFNKNINSPLSGSSENYQNQGAGSCIGPDCPDNEQDLKNKDTDGDGLTDWDELNLYNTSPYLEDSDSDGFSDKSEIDSNNDPNCPSGKQCIGLESGQGASSPEAQGNENSGISGGEILNQLGIEAPASQTNPNSTQEQELQNVLSGQGDAATLRKMLLEAGMSQELLNQISDEDLLKSYQETLGE